METDEEEEPLHFLEFKVRWAPNGTISSGLRVDRARRIQAWCPMNFGPAAAHLHLGKRPTRNLRIILWKTFFPYNPVVFRFHVGLFQGVSSMIPFSENLRPESPRRHDL